ncbi:uncharacterized protein LOC142006825 [Carettochelys insculpta]|uniref:uncharacterized protein LOC142006825 n=1 Tax=Carettochelys insculpta TaxID=44489 RepID=UPI003EB841D5
MRRALSVEKWVGIAVWKLATPDSYRSVGQQFGVGKATVGAVLMEVVRTINAMLLHRLVRLGDPDAAIAGFATLGFPNCLGALDGTHIPIHAPEHSGGWYINRKGYHSVVLQALVDSRGRFLDIMWAGLAAPTMPGYSGTRACAAGWRQGSTSPSGRSLWGTPPCPSASLQMRHTPSGPGSCTRTWAICLPARSASTSA